MTFLGGLIELAHYEVPRRLPKDIVLCLYRIVQEALRNVIKHSGAQTARVQLSGTAEELALQISDTGTGFDPGSVFETYEDILDAACEAWNRLVDQPWRIMSIGLRDWAHNGHSF